MFILDWLSANSGIVQTVSTAVLALVTLAYVILTGILAKQAGRSAEAAERSAQAAETSATASAQLVEESRITRISATEPQVIPGTVEIRRAGPGEGAAGILAIELVNVGPGSAYELAVGYHIGDAGGIQRLGESLRSQETRAIQARLVGDPDDPLSLPREMILQITLEYRGVFGQRQRVQTSHMVMRGGDGSIPCPMIDGPTLSGHMLGQGSQDDRETGNA